MHVRKEIACKIVNEEKGNNGQKVKHKFIGPPIVNQFNVYIVRNQCQEVIDLCVNLQDLLR